MMDAIKKKVVTDRIGDFAEEHPVYTVILLSTLLGGIANIVGAACNKSAQPISTTYILEPGVKEPVKVIKF